MFMDEEILKASAVITPNMMYASIQELTARVGHMSAILEPSLAELRSDINDTKVSIAKNEGRIEILTNKINVVSNRIYTMTGAAAVAGGLGGYIINTLVN